MNRLKSKMNNMKSFFYIPSNVEQIFEEEAIQKNGLTMKFLAVFMIVVEIFNITRVLFFTNSKLSTLNNRIYFTMYVILLISAIVFTLLERKLKNNKKARMYLYVLASYFWMLWHVVLNCYDLRRNPDGDITLFSCAILCLSIFAQLKPCHTISIATLSYIIMILGLSINELNSGGYINATISLVLAYIVVLRVYRLSIVQIYQNIEITDKSEQLKKERVELKSSLEKYEMVLNHTNDYIFEIDFCNEKLIFAKNSRIAKRVGSEIVNVTSWLKEQNIIHKEYTDQLIHGMRELVTMKREVEYTFPVCTIDGSDKWYQLRVFVTDNNDITSNGIGIISDIDIQHKHVEMLTSKTKIDPMTGLLNAVAFKDAYNISINNLVDNENIVMFMIDLDNFKTINDTYGHFAGDCVLKAVANVLSNMFRECDFSARLGGDEFAIIMKKAKDIGIVKRKVEQLTSEISKIEVTEHKINVTCSIGITVINDKQASYEDVYKRVDKVLYEAKSSGKGCYKISN